MSTVRGHCHGHYICSEVNEMKALRKELDYRLSLPPLTPAEVFTSPGRRRKVFQAEGMA